MHLRRPRAPRVRSWAGSAMVLVLAMSLAACGGTAATTVPTPSVTPEAGTPSAATAPAASAADRIPAPLVGAWTGEEFDVDYGVTWASTYRIRDCERHTEPWKSATDAQACGEWEGVAEIEGKPAICKGSLSWLGTIGEAYELLGTGPTGTNVILCWDTWRIHLTPDGRGGVAVETFGDGNPSTSGTLTPAP